MNGNAKGAGKRMTKALRKNTRRSISGSLGRYIAILLIIMLGVAFLTGLPPEGYRVSVRDFSGRPGCPPIPVCIEKRAW